MSKVYAWVDSEGTVHLDQPYTTPLDDPLWKLFVLIRDALRVVDDIT